MDNKIGYAYISLEDYRALIEENKRLEYENEEVIKQKSIVIKEYTSVEKTILEKIYENCDYHITNYDGVNNYHHRQLEQSFNNYGYTNIDKINSLIEELLKRYEEENKEKAEDE